MSGLDLGLIGNCSVAALVDRMGAVTWMCLPRLDGDPVFHALLGRGPGEPGDGAFAIELEGEVRSEQRYEGNTPVLVTTLANGSGTVEITDFMPRFESRGRTFRPQMLVRRIRPLSGWPRVRIRIRPRFEWGAQAPVVTRGSNHVRFVGPGQTLRLTTDAPIDHLIDERLINLDRPFHFMLGPDETISEGVGDLTESFLKHTDEYWRRWSRRLTLPFEWQEAVIRSAITLKLCSYEPTGGIVAAITTSIPEAPDTGRNWDYRFCWVRDAFFTVRALNSLSAMRTLENYFQWLMNLVAESRDGTMQPVYGIGLESALVERTAPELQGFAGMGPVRIGNQAFEHAQHDAYGAVILGAAQAFFDRRLFMSAGRDAFEMLERLGERAWTLHDQPDAGIWELRTRARVHTSSAVMCWAGCDRLAKIAAHLGLMERARHWGERATRIREVVLANAWCETRRTFVESFGGSTLDSSVLLMGEVGFIPPTDPRFTATIDALSAELGRGPFMMRYEEADDFGAPQTSFNICAFWRLDALARAGRTAEAREIFEELLAARNHLGLMSEDTDHVSGAPWGNFPQTYSMVGIINGAMRLSKPWEAML